MEENKENPIQALLAEEQPKETKTKKEGRAIKIWLTVLTAVFTLSMISGLYLALTPGKTVRLADSGKEEGAAAAGKGESLFKKLSAEEGAAVVKIRGIIQEGGDNGFFSKQNSASAISKRIRELADKKEVKALLLDINSPGGTVAAVQDIYNSILFFKSKNKPVVALFRDVAASGGFYVAMAADKIVGRAAALLFAKLKVASVYAAVLSEGGRDVLLAYGIDCFCGELTESIINREGSGKCPMEEATENINDPDEAVAAIGAKLNELRSRAAR